MAGRISQEGIETLQVPGTAAARVTQEGLEGLNIPLRSGVNARVTQQAIETLTIPLRTPATSAARVTQQAIEFLYIPGIPTGIWATEEFYWVDRAAVARR
jgi:hypothetical protein